MSHISWWDNARYRVQSLFSPLLPLPTPGLYTYPVALNGGQRRLHLRIDADHTGVLFVDVTDVIHLNATAAEMAKLALDGVPLPQAQAGLLRRFSGVSAPQLIGELTQIYEMVNRLREHGEACPVCAVVPMLEFTPVFGTPVHAPYKADIALTYRCNNACPHCYNAPDHIGMASVSLPEWRRVVDTLTGIGVPHLILTGGEPTLHPDLAAIIRHADSNGHIVGMNTNGRLLAHQDKMAAIADAGLNHVQITLESSRTEVHNTMVGVDAIRSDSTRGTAFAQTVQGIQNALASGVHTITNTTLTRCNQDHVLEIVDFLYELGLRTFAMNGMIYAGGGIAAPDAIPAEEMAATLVAVRDRAVSLEMRFLWYTVTDYCRLSPLELGLSPKRCNAAEYSMCVEPNGDVLPCQSYYVVAGNLLTDPWESIWNSPLFLSFRERESNPLAAGLPEMCWECPDLAMCGGGCRLERETHDVRREGGCGRRKT
ncbi:MAG: radical SAM protein [Anaerolineae bacterium]|nr:radical SAM protein [Anaerolineae bacterium]